MTGPSDCLRFHCPACGRVHLRWSPQCDKCLAWNLTLIDDHDDTEPVRPNLRIVASARSPAPHPNRKALSPPDSRSVPVRLSDVADDTLVRHRTGLAPLDEILGGGLVVGSVVVVGGEPGMSKSTLVMQSLSGLGLPALYVSGEESVQQAAARAHRIGAASTHVWIVSETRVAAVLDHARRVRAEVLAC